MKYGLRVFRRMGAPCREVPDPGTVLLFSAFLLTVCLTGCNVDVHDGIGPRVPLSNVGGW